MQKPRLLQIICNAGVFHWQPYGHETVRLIKAGIQAFAPLFGFVKFSSGNCIKLLLCAYICCGIAQPWALVFQLLNVSIFLPEKVNIVWLVVWRHYFLRT